MKASSPILVPKNKNYFFYLFLNQICALSLILRTRFFLQIKLRAQKIGHVDVNLSSLALKCQREIAAENGMWLTHPSRLEYVLDC